MEELNIYQKLAKIGEPVKVLKKSKKGFNYTYTPEEEILAGIQGRMDEYHVSLIPSIVPQTTVVTPHSYIKTKATGSGKIIEENINEILISGEMEFTWVNNDNPEDFIKVPWFFTGQQGDASQAFGSALTYASRYFKLQYFQIATTNDPDAIIAKKKEVEQLENKKINDELIEQIKNVIESFLKQYEKGTEDYDAARDMLLAIVKKHAGTGNYLKVTDPKISACILDELTKVLKGKDSK